METILLDTGTRALAKALVAGDRIKLGSFQIGAATNFRPDPTSTTAFPAPIYIGTPATISTSVVNENQIRYAVTLVESVGPFTIGNIMLFLQDTEGNQIPYLFGVLPIPVPKYLGNPPASVGNRIIFNMTVKFMNIAQAFQLVVMTPTYSSLASYPDELGLPVAYNASYQQSMIQNTTKTGTPGLVARRDVDDTWFINTFFERLDDPLFGAIQGGVAGDGYVPFYGLYCAGGLYGDLSTVFRTFADGGQDWVAPDGLTEPIDGGDY